MTDQYLLDLFRYGRCCDTCKHAVSCQWEADEERYYTHTHTTMFKCINAYRTPFKLWKIKDD